MDLRVILIITRTEFEKFQYFINAGYDVLVVDELVSPTHGTYEQLDQIDNRRLAAFICALFLKQRYHVTFALIMDDNLQNLFVNSIIEYLEDAILIHSCSGK